MEAGEVIRELRKDRKMTQQQLANGISHRTTLNSFENLNSKTSFNDLHQYLERLNVSLEEFEFLLRDGIPDKKKKLARKISILMHTKYDPKVSKELLHHFQTSDDFFFYILYANYYLYRMKVGDKLDPQKAVELSKEVRKYLEGISTWGRFELTLFTNCLYLFDGSYIRFEFEQSIQKMQIYREGSNFSQDLFNFLVNGLALSFERKDMDNVVTFLSELENLASEFDSTEANLYFLIFKVLLDHHQGEDNQKEKYELLFILRVLNENGWIRYIENNY